MWRDIEARNRQLEELGERLELRIHAIAMVLTAIVLAMRLAAGTQDLTGSTSSFEDGGAPPAGDQPAPAGVP